MAVTINEGTQTDILTVVNSGTEIQVIKLDVGAGTAISDFGGTVRDVANITKGTVTKLEGGTVNVNMLSGTLNVGTVANAGTVVEVNKGTINLGTVAVSFLPSGGTILNLAAGTLGTVLGIGGTVAVSGASSGTVVEVNKGTINLGTVAISNTPTVNVATGTINVGTATVSGNVGISTGTITTGSITNVASLHTGTITTGSIANVAMVHAGTHVHPTGTVTTIAAGTQNTLGTVGAVNAIVAGTQNTLGTVGVVNNIVTGTLAALTNLAGGTVKLNETPVNLATSLTTNGTTGAAVWGTLVAASGAGTKQYVSGVDVVVSSGTVEVAVTNIGVGGSAGAGVLTRGVFIAGGGISKDFYPVIASGTNGTLSYWLGGAGTANITVQYWQGV